MPTDERGLIFSLLLLRVMVRFRLGIDSVFGVKMDDKKQPIEDLDSGQDDDQEMVEGSESPAN